MMSANAARSGTRAAGHILAPGDSGPNLYSKIVDLDTTQARVRQRALAAARASAFGLGSPVRLSSEYRPRDGHRAR